MDELRLFGTPEVDLEDAAVIDDIRGMRVALADVLRVPRRWSGGLRRTTQARAIRGSNTIEGYRVSAEDAVAAVDEEPPVSADERTWVEIIGYRRVLTYILRMAPEPGFAVDSQLLRSLHFMLLDVSTEQGEPMVDAAMAHLNLVMIHPFRDGNGRMARALQTLVMARDQVLEPTYSGVEEWLAANTEDYYRVLALTGGGAGTRATTPGCG
ncbi:MAG: Fic family protein [Candidatus Nanopelagicales bacterium]